MSRRARRRDRDRDAEPQCTITVGYLSGDGNTVTSLVWTFEAGEAQKIIADMTARNGQPQLEMVTSRDDTEALSTELGRVTAMYEPEDEGLGLDGPGACGRGGMNRA